VHEKHLKSVSNMHCLLFLSFSSTSISFLRTYISSRIYREKMTKTEIVPLITQTK
jgi:hypothetical protein